MRRIYCLVPNEAICRELTQALEARGEPKRHLHVLANLNHPLHALPGATPWETTELAHGIRLGLGLGGMAGILGGLLAVSFPPAGLILGGGALLASAAAGAGLGALISALLGAQAHNHHLDRFQRAIDEGQLLLIVDVPQHHEEEVRELIRHHHPSVRIEAQDRPPPSSSRA